MGKNLKISVVMATYNRAETLVETISHLSRQTLNPKHYEVIIIDDGAATGATMEAAIKWLRKKKAKRIVVALPVAPPEIIASLTPKADELVVLESPAAFSAVGEWYKEFAPVEDAEVIQLLS